MEVETIKSFTKGDINDLKAYANAIGVKCENCTFRKIERDLSRKHSNPALFILYCELTCQNIKELHFCSNFIKKETND